MADFKTLNTDSAKCRAAASASDDLVRKGELDTALALKAAAAHTHANDHVAVTIGGTSQSLDLTVVGQQIDGEIDLDTNSGLVINAGGLACNWGTGQYNVARGNHTHTNDHVAATADAAQDDSATITVTGQAIKCAVNLSADGGLKLNGDGIAADVGTAGTQVSAGNHTHANATGATPGFMSAAHWVKLNNLPSTAEDPLTFGNTATINLSRVGDNITAAANLGTGLTEGASTIDVDFTAVAAADHTHADGTGGAAGFLSTTLFTKLDGLRTNAQNDAVYVKLAGSATTPQSTATPITIAGGDASTPSLIANFDVWGKAKLYVGATKDTWFYRDGVNVVRTDGQITAETIKSTTILVKCSDNNYRQLIGRQEVDGSWVIDLDQTPV